jgi:hypothetical protein
LTCLASSSSLFLLLDPLGATPESNFFASLVVKFINMGAIDLRFPLRLAEVGEVGDGEVGIVVALESGADFGGSHCSVACVCDTGELCIRTDLARSSGLGPIVARRVTNAPGP